MPTNISLSVNPQNLTPTKINDISLYKMYFGVLIFLAFCVVLLFVFLEGSCLIYVICVSLRIVVPNSYCVVFLLCFSLFCVPYVASFSGLSIIFDCPFCYSLTFIRPASCVPNVASASRLSMFDCLFCFL